MITKLMNWAGVEPEYACKGCNGKHESCEQFIENTCNNGHPELTPEKAWKLEDMILDKVKRFELTNHRYCYQMGFGGNKSCYEKAGTGETRIEALASLITQIDWSEQEKEQIRGILND